MLKDKLLEERKKELDDQFKTNTMRAYQDIKQIVLRETQDNQVLANKYKELEAQAKVENIKEK